MQRLWFLPVFAFLLALAALPSAAQEQKESASTLESQPNGWIDLLADGRKHWKRVPIPPGGKLKQPDPWSFDTETKTILCKGVGYHEMLLYDRLFGDGIFHVEWRFREVPNKKGYNSGVYVRNSADGKIWHQAQVGSKNVGHIFGDTPQDDKLRRISTPKLKGPQRGKEAGQWNTYEITCQGKTLKLWINGAITTSWEECNVPRGYLGLEAEGWVIEFKNPQWRPLHGKE